MLRTCTLCLALTLTACASSSGEGTTTDWGANSFVNAANLGDGQWLITCERSASACTRRARKVCPAGYDVLDLGSGTSTVAGGSLSGFAVNSKKDYELMVLCKE